MGSSPSVQAFFSLPDIEPAAETLAALAHSRQPPVACTLSLSQNQRVHPYPVVAHAKGEIRIPKSDFGLDMSGVGMLVCVANGLPPDSVSFITHDGNQLAGPALDHYPVLRPGGSCDCNTELGPQ